MKDMTKKYNPMSKEFQEEAKRLGLTGYQLIQKYKENGNIVNSTYINRRAQLICYKKSGCNNHSEYRNVCAQILGFRNDAERQRERDHYNGKQLPMEFNEDCSSYFGVYIAENYIMKTFEDPIKMPYGNPGYDWLCKTGKKIESKARCMSDHSGCIGFGFDIYYNNIADYFILSAWNNRDSLEPLHIWVFHRNDIVRNAPFWNRNGFWITNRHEYLAIFDAYEVKNRLDKLKEVIRR
jgi:hypothetical protein